MSANARSLTDHALAEARRILHEAESPADFFAGADALLADPANTLALPVELELSHDVGSNLGSSGTDAEAAVAIFEFLGPMAPANAADARLWSYLALVTFREYMSARWPLEGDSWKGRAEKRWLLRATREGLTRHGIARLWWLMDLTHDPHLAEPLSQASGDPLAYGRAALANQDRVVSIFERELGAHSNLVRSVLEHLESSPSRTGNYVKALMKELVLVAGYRDFAVVDRDGARAAVEEAGDTVMAKSAMGAGDF